MTTQITKHLQSCFVVWVLIAILQPQTSSAQFGWWQTLEPMTSREAFTKCLISLDVKDTDVFWILYDNMALTITKEATAFEETMINGKDDDRISIWKRTKSWNNTRLGMQLQFEEDVALNLDQKQQDNWRKFTRLFRRERVIPEMAFHVNHVVLLDLLDVLDSLDLNDNEFDGLKDICGSYEESLNLLLIAWEQKFGEIYAELFRLQPLVQAKDKKAKDANELEMAKLYKLATDVRELNTSIDVEMASFMEPDHMQIFLMIVTSKDFPGLFVPSPVDLTAKRLKSFKGITDEQHGIIQAIYNDYKLKRSTDRQQMIVDLRHWNSQKQTARRFVRLDEFLKNGMTRSEAIKIFAREHVCIPHLKRLRTHEQQTCETIRELFSSEQFIILPAEVRLYLSLWSPQE